MMDITHLRLVAKSLYRNLNPRSTLDHLLRKKTERLLGILQAHHFDLAQLRPSGDVVTLATPNFRPLSLLTIDIDYADQSALTFSALIRPGPAGASRQPQKRNSLVRSPLIYRANQELVNFAATPEMSHDVTVPNELADLIA
jgi:hypothetical protein